MKIFSIIGKSKSGKTTTIENIIKELVRRNYTVGTIKEINTHSFKMDIEGTNTQRHKEAGASLVCARGMGETDLMFQEKLNINDVLDFYSHDFVIMEGVRDTCAPKIVAARDIQGLEDRMDETAFAVTGVISAEMDQYKGLPAINALTDIEILVDLIEEKVFDRLPDVKDECCMKCGHTCKELCSMILKGEAHRMDCVLTRQEVTLTINGKEVPMVPFVQRILRNSVKAVAKELNGYREDGEIEINIR